MLAWLHRSSAKAVTLSFEGTRKRGPFEAHDLEAYRRLLPHISRSLEIRDRLERAQVRGRHPGATDGYTELWHHHS